MAKAFRTEIESLREVGKANVHSQEVYERLLESVFLNGITEFEAFLEDVFLAAVAKNIRPGATQPIVNFGSPHTARALVMRPNEHYLGWLPIDYSLTRASQFLIDGIPFSRLGTRNSVTGRLGVAMTVRNAVAHKGNSALGRFKKVTAEKYGTPGEYLAATSGDSTICDGFLADFVRFGRALCASDAEADKLLGPEDPLPAGKKVEAGRYQCINCETTYSLEDDEVLACPTCDPACSTCGVASSKSAHFRLIR